MDAKVDKPADVSTWVPEARVDGKVEIFVGFFHEGAGRIVAEGIGPEQYAGLWKSDLLKFQQEGKPRPEHLPTLEQVEAFLALKSADRPKRSFSPAADRLIEESLQTPIPPPAKKPKASERVEEDDSEPEPEEEASEEILDSDPADEAEEVSDEGSTIQPGKVEISEDEDEPDISPDEQVARTLAKYADAINEVSKWSDWSTADFKKKTELVAELLGLKAWIVASFLRLNPDLLKTPTAPAAKVDLPQPPSRPVEVPNEAVKFEPEPRLVFSLPKNTTREEKVLGLRIARARLKDKKAKIKIQRLINEATMRGGPLEGKLTPTSLRTFVYEQLTDEEKGELFGSI